MSLKKFLIPAKITFFRNLSSKTINELLTKLSIAHANSTYQNDDEAIAKSLKEHYNHNKIKNKIFKLENELLTKLSIAHANSTYQNDDEAIGKSLKKQ